MNPKFTNNSNAKAFPICDALCPPRGASRRLQGALHLPRDASKNLLGAPHRRPDAVINKQGFSCFSGRARVKKLAQISKFRLASWNIGSLTGKLMELVDCMIRRNINILCLQETKWVGEKAKEIENSGFKLYYSGKERHRNGVGVIVANHLINSVVKIIRKGDRIILVKLVIGGTIVNIISAYAPQVGLDDQTKDYFWEQMDATMQEIPLGEKIFIGGDFNGHVGNSREGYETVHGGFGFGRQNIEGKSILDFAVAFDMKIMNTFFRKRDEHLITFKSGVNKSQIDFFLVRGVDRLACKDCKVIPGECVVTQHRLLVLDISLKIHNKIRKSIKTTRTRWWSLQGDKLVLFKDKLFNDCRWDVNTCSNDMWEGMANSIRKIAREVLGESKGRGPISKETWWWSDAVQAIVKVKKETFKKWQKDKSEVNFKSYKQACKEAKKAVGDAKMRSLENFYARLDSKDGEKDIYKLAKWREKKSKDISQVKCIKDDNDNILLTDDEIKQRWKDYFDKLLNEEYERCPKGEKLGDTRTESKNQEYVFYRRVQKSEVVNALRRMKSGKALGPDNIPIEVWKCLGDKGVIWLTKLFNKILLTRKMPDEWRKSILVPIYKNKGDIQNCNNYRGIKLISHTMKLWERVIENRLRMLTTVSENQFGFMPGKSTMEAIYLLRKLIEKYREKKKDLHMIFIDLEKAYDRIPRDIIWRVLEKKCVMKGYIDVIKDMYEGAVTTIRSPVGETKEFPIRVGLHQGSALSPYLFTLVIDEVTRSIQEDIPWCMLFADDIVLIDETARGVNAKLELWRETLEAQGFRISRSKTEYMECKFSDVHYIGNDIVTLQSHELPKCERFKYLGSIFSKDGEIVDDVTHRIQVGWLKWRSASGVLCDRKIPTKLKGKFYRTAIRPALLYSTECWATKKQHVNKMGVTEMRMLRWICGKTLRDRIKNECIRDMVGVAPIEAKIRENRLKWFGHVFRRPADAVVKRSDRIIVKGCGRGRGRPKLTLESLIQKDMRDLNIAEHDALDRVHWKSRIHVADPI